MLVISIGVAVLFKNTFEFKVQLWWNGPWMAPFSKLCPVIPTSNQNGHQDEI
jgi:hypothetical protein